MLAHSPRSTASDLFLPAISWYLLREQAMPVRCQACNTDNFQGEENGMRIRNRPEQELKLQEVAGAAGTGCDQAGWNPFAVTRLNCTEQSGSSSNFSLETDHKGTHLFFPWHKKINIAIAFPLVLVLQKYRKGKFSSPRAAVRLQQTELTQKGNKGSNF